MLILYSLVGRGKNVKYVLFEGEGHKWRKAENIKAGLEAELDWYKELIGITRTAEM